MSYQNYLDLSGCVFIEIDLVDWFVDWPFMVNGCLMSSQRMYILWLVNEILVG